MERIVLLMSMKIRLDIDLKTIMLDHQNTYVARMMIMLQEVSTL